MALTTKQKAAAVKVLEALIEHLNEDEDENGEDEDEDEDEKPSRKSKSKKPAAKRGRAKDEDEDENGDDDGEGDDEADEDAPTLNEIRKLAVSASKKATDGKEKVLAALQRHGSDRLTEIDEDNYPDLKEMLEKIIEDDDYDPRDSSKKKKPAAKKTRSKKSEDF